MRSPAHLPGPEHDRLVEQPALLQVGDERRDRLLRDAGVLLVVLLQVAVLIPRGIVPVETRAGDLDEPHTGFDHPPGAQSLRGIVALVLVLRIDPVELADRFGLAADVGECRHFRLHPKGRLVIRDGPVDGLAIGGHRCERAILLGQQCELAALDRGRIARRDVVDGDALRAHHRRLVTRGKEGAAEVFQPAVRHPVVVQHDVAGEVAVRGAEAVRHPRAEARSLPETAPGVQQEVRLPVEREFADHRADDAEFVGDAGDVREEVADPEAALAALLELPRAAEPDALGRRLRPLRDGAGADRLPFVLLQHRLVIEGIDVTRPTVHEAENDALRLRSCGDRRRSVGEQSVEREPAEAERTLFEEAAPIGGGVEPTGATEIAVHGVGPSIHRFASPVL